MMNEREREEEGLGEGDVIELRGEELREEVRVVVQEEEALAGSDGEGSLVEEDEVGLLVLCFGRIDDVELAIDVARAAVLLIPLLKTMKKKKKEKVEKLTRLSVNEEGVEYTRTLSAESLK